MNIPAMPGVMSNTERHAQMQMALDRFPFLTKYGRFRNDRVSVACYGPSLKETWARIRRPIISVSGAHDFLIERGVVPDWHVDMDPRPNKASMNTPHHMVRYLMASVCHPDLWDLLEGFDVQLWHLINGNDYETIQWVGEHHPAGMDCLIGGGSTVGQRALNVAAVALGYRRFEIHGMDCSFHVEQHAGPHSGNIEKMCRVVSDGREFKTTPQMVQAAYEMIKFMQTQDAEVVFYGDGLMQDMARRYQEGLNL